MITFDIKDLYVNIPIKETLRIMKILLLENNNENTRKQMITLLEVTLQQNYFSFCNNIYQPEKGVFMGSPISNTDYGLYGPGSNPSGDEIFRPSRPALGPTQPPVQWVPYLSWGEKRLGRWADSPNPI